MKFVLSLPEDDYHLVSNASITNVVGMREWFTQQRNSASRESLLNMQDYIAAFLQLAVQQNNIKYPSKLAQP